MSWQHRKLKKMTFGELIQVVRNDPRIGEDSGHPVAEVSDHELVQSARAHPDRTLGRWLQELESHPQSLIDTVQDRI